VPVFRAVRRSGLTTNAETTNFKTRMSTTETQYRHVIQRCKDLFLNKNKDYGTAWRILRLSSITDQIFIKAQRIRTLQETGVSKVGEGIEPEFVGIINYCVMALIQIQLQSDSTEAASGMDIPTDELEQLYDEQVGQVMNLLFAKNHDYGEAWRDMRVSSMTDIILMKLLRTKQIEDNQGNTLVSEGVEANYMDMINYAVFCLIKSNAG
jgi:Nucleotide modification associated domain 1